MTTYFCLFEVKIRPLTDTHGYLRIMIIVTALFRIAGGYSKNPGLTANLSERSEPGGSGGSPRKEERYQCVLVVTSYVGMFGSSDPSSSGGQPPHPAWLASLGLSYVPIIKLREEGRRHTKARAQRAGGWPPRE